MSEKETNVGAVEEMHDALPEELDGKVAGWLYDTLFVPAEKYREKAGDGEWPRMRALGLDNDPYFGRGDLPYEEDDDVRLLSANVIMPTMDTVKGIALQSPSVVEFVPQEPDDEQFAAELSTVVGEYLWHVRKARFKLGVGFAEGATVGTAWSKTFWNPDLLGGEGDADFDVLPADEVYVDPTTRGINAWQYIIHAPMRPVVEIKYDEQHYNTWREEVSTENVKSEGQKKDSAQEVLELTPVYEYWLKGIWLKALENEVPEFATHIDDTARKYGMKITVASGHVLNFGFNPNECDRFPIQRFVYYAPIGNQRIYGHGEPKFMEDVQDAINDRLTQMNHQAAMIANNQWIVSTMAVTDEDELTNKVGAIVHVDGPPDVLRRIEAQGISGSLFGFTNLLMELTQIISGMYEVNRGEQPGSIRAGVAIQALQRGGEGRTAQKMANFDEWVADIGMGLADVIAVMYDSERTFRIVGSAADALNDRFPAEVEAEEPTEPELQDPNYIPTEEEPEKRAPATREIVLSKDSFKKDGGKRIDLDVRAQIGMMLRSTMDQLVQDIELLEKGVVDVQYVIENNQLRGKERLLMRLFQVAAQNEAPQGGEAGMPVTESPTGNDSYMGDDDAAGMSQAIEAALAQVEQLEAQGIIPPGSMQQIEQAIANEIQQGGTGEQTLMEVMQVIEQIMAQQGGPETIPEPGVAPMM